MGEARRRGDYEKRKSEAIDSGRKKVKKISQEEFRQMRLDILSELIRKNLHGVIGRK